MTHSIENFSIELRFLDLLIWEVSWPKERRHVPSLSLSEHPQRLANQSFNKSFLFVSYNHSNLFTKRLRSFFWPRSKVNLPQCIVYFLKLFLVKLNRGSHCQELTFLDLIPVNGLFSSLTSKQRMSEFQRNSTPTLPNDQSFKQRYNFRKHLACHKRMDFQSFFIPLPQRLCDQPYQSSDHGVHALKIWI